jgi:hypothetical protein
MKLLLSIPTTDLALLSGKDTFLRGAGAAEAFQSLFSHIDGNIRDGYGEDGRYLTQHSPYL